MSSSLKIISNSTKHSGFLSCTSFRSERDLPSLEERGIRNGGIAAIQAPYEMRRAGGTEDRHVTVWLIQEGTVQFEVPGRRFTAPPGSTLVMNSDVDRLCRVESGIFRHIYFTLAPDALAGEAVYSSSYESSRDQFFVQLPSGSTVYCCGSAAACLQISIAASSCRSTV